MTFSIISLSQNKTNSRYSASIDAIRATFSVSELIPTWWNTSSEMFVIKAFQFNMFSWRHFRRVSLSLNGVLQLSTSHRIVIVNTKYQATVWSARSVIHFENLLSILVFCCICIRSVFITETPIFEGIVWGSVPPFVIKSSHILEFKGYKTNIELCLKKTTELFLADQENKMRSIKKYDVAKWDYYSRVLRYGSRNEFLLLIMVT